LLLRHSVTIAYCCCYVILWQLLIVVVTSFCDNRVLLLLRQSVWATLNFVQLQTVFISHRKGLCPPSVLQRNRWPRCRRTSVHILWPSDGSVITECGSEWVRYQTVALVAPPWSAVGNGLNLCLKLSSLNSGLYSLLHSTVLVVHK